MALTCWCKKCGKDVPVGERCSECGGKLGKNTVRCAWLLEHNPALDWMKWNSIMRILLPVFLVLVVLIVALEGAIGGIEGIKMLLTSGMMVTLLLILALACVVVLLVLLLQGDDLLDCVCDQKGIHVQTYLKKPTRLKLILRMKSPEMMEEYEETGQLPLTGQAEILWKDVCRVQCWREKTTVLFYSPSWWMRTALVCTPFTYEDVLTICRDKLGKKKNVTLPGEVTSARTMEEDCEISGQMSMEITPGGTEENE